MEREWAKRIKSRLDELRGGNQNALAAACGVRPSSVSNWFGKGTSTKMIAGDNLVAAARFLETTAEWIITGRGGHTAASFVREPLPPYQDSPLSAERLAAALDAAQRAFAKTGQIPNATALAAGTVLALRQMDAGDGKAAIIAAVAQRLKELGNATHGTIDPSRER